MRVLVFGEILWDVFPTERAIGGAPLNFAAHLNRLGCDAKIVSAVGDDELGRQSLAALETLALDTRYVSVLARETGMAKVTLDSAGTPSYELVEGVAYDAIPAPQEALDELRAGSFDAVYFGTLSQRAEESRAALQALAAQAGSCMKFCDLNIRQHFYSRQVVNGCLESVNILKISRDEAGVFAELGICDTPLSGTAEDARVLGKALFDRYPGIRELLLTLDKDGAAVYLPETDTLLVSDKPNCTVVSTVGGGDSFSACYLYNRLAGVSPEESLKRGQALSSYVVTQLGAIPDYPPALYNEIK